MTQPLIIGGDIGGIPKHRYWTPDGREILSIPCMRITNKGETRDANYDKGWLSEPPKELKLYCPHCDYWHDTEEEVEECGKKVAARKLKFNKWARKQMKGEVKEKNKEIDALRSELSELKEMVAKLVAKE